MELKKVPELKVSYGTLTLKNWELLQIINKLCLPVIYSEQFYLSLVGSKNKYCRLGFFNTIISSLL